MRDIRGGADVQDHEEGNMRKVALALAAGAFLLFAGSFPWKADATMVGTAADFARGCEGLFARRSNRLQIRRLLQAGLRDGVQAVRLLLRPL